MAPTNTVSRQSVPTETSETQISAKSYQGVQAQDVAEAKKDETLPQQTYTRTQITALRVFIGMGIMACYVYTESFQGYIDSTYDYLKHQWWFEIVYFETGLVIVFSFPAVASYQILDMISYFDKYRIEPRGGRIASESIPELVAHSIEYMLPFALLDTFHVKHYYGVGDEIIAVKRKDWIQRTRALPDYAPQLWDIALHIFVAIVIYDAVFFVLHYNMHKNPTLYKMFHKKHHTHEVINVKVTDHQHWMERILFILCTNGGLKIQGAHPFTRMIFVFVYASMILYNHSGYDFPFGLDKIVPFQLIGGSRQHYEHHAKGKRYYQFIFTYLDNTLEWMQKREKEKRKIS